MMIGRSVNVKIVYFLLILFVIVGCSDKVRLYEAENYGVVFTNNTKNYIDKINIVECGQQETIANVLTSGKIMPGETLSILLKKDCVDMRAYSSDGLLMGSQMSVSIPPTLYWKVY